MDARDENLSTFFELLDSAMSNRLPAVELQEIKKRMMSDLLARRKQRPQSSSSTRPRLSDDITNANVIVSSPASPEIPRGPALSAASEISRKNTIAEEVQLLDSRLDQDRLLQLFQTDLGFDGELPVSACVMYNALVHWRSFETESKDVFDKIMGIMRAAIGAQDPSAAPGADAGVAPDAQPEAARFGAGEDEDAVGSIDKLAYWLTNAASLLLLLLRSFYTDKVPREMAAFRKAIFSPTVPSEDEIAAAKADGVQLVKPTFPALLFGKELAAYVEKVYLFFANNLRNDVSPILVAGYEASTRILRNSNQQIPRAAAQSQAISIPAAEARWSLITMKLSEMLNILKMNHVPAFLVRTLFRQIYALINAELFNRVLLYRHFCNLHFVEAYFKEGLTELQRWTAAATDVYAGGAWDQLQHIRQAVEFIVLPEKSEMTLEEIHSHFPALSMQHLYRIGGMIPASYHSATFVTRAMMDAIHEKCKKEVARYDTDSFLLDTDRRIPFSVSDMYKEQPRISLNDLLVPPHFP